MPDNSNNLVNVLADIPLFVVTAGNNVMVLLCSFRQNALEQKT